MGIQHHIERIKERPEHEKKRIALTYSGIITGAIFIVWLSVLLPHGAAQSNVAAVGAANSGSPSLSQIGNEIQQGYSGVQAQMSDISGQFNSAGTALSASAPEGVNGDASSSAASSEADNAGAVGLSGTSSVSKRQYDFGY